MTQDINHGFPAMIDDMAGAYGKVGNIVGKDGIKRTVVELPGTINGKSGIFQCIIESDGITVKHRFFTSMNKSLLGGLNEKENLGQTVEFIKSRIKWSYLENL